MISYENTKTVGDLVWNTGREYAGRVFLRYEENDVVYEVTYDEFADQCRAVSAWLQEQDAAAGHKVRVGLMGSSSHHYLVFLLGVMASGNVVVPLDVQLNEETFADNVNRSDLDILFYDDCVIQEPDFCVPHVDMQNRDFVLKPLCEIAPYKRHPVYGWTVSEMLSKLSLK